MSRLRAFVACALLAACSSSVGSADRSPGDTPGSSAPRGTAVVPTATTDDAPAGPATTSMPPPTADTEPPAPPPPLPAVRLEIGDPRGGFAQLHQLSGGLGGEAYVVTSTADHGPGTYRDALSSGGRYITFDPSIAGARIELGEPVIVTGSDITLDGSGADVEIGGSATRFSGTNIIVAGMSYTGVDNTDDEDALTFLDPDESQVVGLFNNRFSSTTDGLVDFIWNRGHDVYATVCGNRFERHDKAMLIHSGRNGREGGRYHVTLCHNVWSDIYQRAPLSRDAWVHQYNSVFERFGKSNGNGGGSKAGEGDVPSQHLLEHNVAVPRAVGDTTFDGSEVRSPRTEWAGPQLDGDGFLRITGTRLERVGDVTATENEQDPDRVFDPPYPYDLAPATPALRDAVLATAGTCVPAGRSGAIPCAPLVLRTAGATLTAQIDGVADEVWFELDGTRLGPAVDGGDGTWTFTLGPGAQGPAPLSAVARTVDGRVARSDPVVLAVVD